jgi:nicotinamidase-related amidase
LIEEPDRSLALALAPDRTALVTIDLQRGIVGRPVAPHAAADVVARAVRLADAARAAGAFVVLVRVGPSPDGRDALRPLADAATPAARGPYDPRWLEIVPELGPRDGDHVVHKRQWGAFYGTDLDLQLRRRGIDTIVLCGIATNVGVESTARAAYEHGYQQVFVEDAMAAMSAEEHAHSLRFILPRIGRVRTTEQVLAAFNRGAGR